ncbi:MAG: tetratricopeptide repeat protein [Nostoc sp.]|uniref:tetratricopeptide repeat protein n=1 Tax=Nostoc sp. TaxID=1180 RepID=UPI002FF17265
MDEAIRLYNQSLEITERIGYVQSKAATLHQLGIIHADKGEVEQAIALYNKSLEITERIGDVQIKAATLHCLEYLRQQRGSG